MRGDRLLHASAYIAPIAVGVDPIRQAYGAGQQWPAAALLVVAFGILMAFVPDATPDGTCATPLWQVNLFLGMQTGIAIPGGVLIAPSVARKVVAEFARIAPQPPAPPPLPGRGHRQGLSQCGPAETLHAGPHRGPIAAHDMRLL